MSHKLSCSFCQARLYSNFYYCCDQNEISCIECTRYGCHVCHKPFIETSEKCQDCFQYFRKKHLQIVNGWKNCVSCCRNKINPGKYDKYFGRLIYEKDRNDIQVFIKKYCTKCNKYLEPSQENQKGKKQILSLNDNLCQGCKSQRDHRPANINQRDYNIGSRNKQSNLYENDTARNRSKCISCDLEICGSSTEIEGGGRVCGYCCKQSNENEKALDNSRTKLKLRENQMEENKENEEQDKQSSKIKSGEKVKIVHMSSIQRQQKMRKSDSEQLLVKIPLNIRMDEKEELIECYNCGYDVQAIDSIWMDTQNVPFCRCCYTDVVTCNTHRAKRIKYQPQHQNKHDKLLQQPLVQYPIYPQKQLIHSQPVIKKEIGEKTQNKVNKSESQNDVMVKESVVDHQERKKESKVSQDKVSESHNNKKPEQKDLAVRSLKEQINFNEALAIDQHKANQLKDEKAQLRKSSKVSANEINSKQPKEQTTEQQQSQKKSQVKRLQSKDDQMILKPAVDHERRDKGKISERQQQKEQLTEMTINKSNLRNYSKKSQTNEKQNLQNFIQDVKNKEDQQKHRISSHQTNSIKTQDPSTTVDSYKNNQSFTSDKLSESKISTKSSVKNHETSSLHNQDLGQKQKQTQTKSRHKVSETIQIGSKNNIHDETNKIKEKQPYQNSEYYGSNNKKILSFPSKTTISRFIDKSKKDATQPQQSTVYKSPDRATYHYSNLPNLPPTHHQTYSHSGKVMHPESTQNRDLANQIKERQTFEQKTVEHHKNRAQLTCGCCNNKFIILQKSYCLENKPVCLECWGNYNKMMKEKQRVNLAPRSY